MRDNHGSMADQAQHRSETKPPDGDARPGGMLASQVLGIVLLFAFILALAWFRFLRGL